MNRMLDQIIQDRRRRQPVSIDSHKMQLLLKDCQRMQPVRSFRRALENRPAVIAEIKRCSPSKGEFGGFREVSDLAASYEKHGAAAISVLSNEQFFGMQKTDITTAAKAVSIPVLRKEFIISEFDVLETRLLGADAILLIARLHNDAKLATLHGLARQIGLEVLMEVHDAEELARVQLLDPEIIGVNARNLDSLQMDLPGCLELAAAVPAGVRVVAESGISQYSDMQMFIEQGISSFLIGTELLRHDRPEKRLAELLMREDSNEPR